MLSAILAASGVAFPAALYAQGFLMLSGGTGGTANAAKAGIEAGKSFPKSNHRFLLGGGFSVAVNGRPGERFPDFQAHIRNERQIGGVAGLRLFQNLYVVATGGLSERAEKDYFVANGEKIFVPS